MPTSTDNGAGRVRVVIVDDHPVALDGARRAVEQDARLSVVGTATSGITAVTLVTRVVPDVLVLDLHLPDISGIEVAKRLQKWAPNVAIVMLTGYDDLGYERVLREIGVRAFLRKTADAAEIASTVYGVSKGRMMLSAPNRSGAVSGMADPLTQREQEVLQLIAAGLQNTEISNELGITLRTVEFHVTNILGKLGARSRSDAREFALRLGWMSPPERRRSRP